MSDVVAEPAAAEPHLHECGLQAVGAQARGGGRSEVSEHAAHLGRSAHRGAEHVGADELLPVLRREPDGHAGRSAGELAGGALEDHRPAAQACK